MGVVLCRRDKKNSNDIWAWKGPQGACMAWTEVLGSVPHSHPPWKLGLKRWLRASTDAGRRWRLDIDVPF